MIRPPQNRFPRKLTPKLPDSRWRNPKVARAMALVLAATLLIELIVIAVHLIGEAPARQGNSVADKAERRLGQGPLSPRTYRINYEKLDQRLRQLMDRREMVGLGIAVIEDGQLSFIKTYGETEAGSGEKVTPQTQFRWASVSKGVAATLITLLDSQHKLSLSDPISKWSSSLKLPKDNQNVAKLSDVLSHRVGIVKNAYDDKLEEGIDPALIRGMFGPLYPMCPPGTCFGYQNVAFDSVHEAVEKATGMSYDEAARKLLFEPLGMTSASTTRDGLVNKARWARPHEGRRVLPVPDFYFRVPAAGGMSSSIIDLGIWMRAQMGGAPRVLPQSVLFTLHVPRVTTPKHGMAPYDQMLKNSAYGLGFRSSDYEGHHVVWHRGAVRGSRSLMIFDPINRFGVAMLWNTTSVRPTAVQAELLDEYYQLPFRDWLQLGKP